ncbi:MAG: hypothetical protein H7039_23320, partial [Bryobacteraceae bacterium]|nr:hypothetical protein [Bryobacteraceae bacterium]
MTRSGRAYVLSLAAFYLLFLLALLALHWPFLSLPYFWDELGQFVPAALDIYTAGAWIPKTTLPNVHPPGVMAWLALAWSAAGYSIATTRVAMLLVAAAGVLATFLLTIELCRDLPGAPAFAAPGLLLASPLFWSQSMMAQLDMPAMTFTCLALWLFLRGQIVVSALVCTALVLCKETSLPVPFVFACFLIYERRYLAALWFLIPLLALGTWLVVLHQATGHWLGNAEFTHYNVAFQLHPVRLPLTVLRRLWYLLGDNLHFLGTAAIIYALRKTPVFRTREWRVVLGVATLQTAVVCALGGAALERYLLPVIPLFYAAVSVGFSTLI